MKKIIFVIAIVMTSAFGIFKANENNSQISELKVDELEAFADWVDGEYVDDPRDKKGLFNWASYLQQCPKKDENGRSYMDSGTICISGPGLCLWDDPCD